MTEPLPSSAIAAVRAMLKAVCDGHGGGVTSVCSAHPGVIATALAGAASRGAVALIEATCNQVNQDGGYTGQTPAEFRQLVLTAASRARLPTERLMLGGDHLGPNAWRHLPAADAMARAEGLVHAFATAGYAKLHLDASMGCAGDPSPLPPATIAARAARLAAVAERAAPGLPLYVVGTEVPTPGGANHALQVTPTAPADVEATLALHRDAFAAQGIAGAMARVVAVVVQPGVEFGPEEVHAYRPAAARDLVAALAGDLGTGLVFEAHSTDYQSESALAALVADRFAILKVGPELTFAWREAALALDMIDAELHPDAPAGVRAAVEAAMAAQPVWWHGHHAAGDNVGRLFSRSDRVRYYWPDPGVNTALHHMLARFGERELPATLLSQFRPGTGQTRAAAILDEAVARVLARYAAATG